MLATPRNRVHLNLASKRWKALLVAMTEHELRIARLLSSLEYESRLIFQNTWKRQEKNFLQGTRVTDGFKRKSTDTPRTQARYFIGPRLQILSDNSSACARFSIKSNDRGRLGVSYSALSTGEGKSRSHVKTTLRLWDHLAFALQWLSHTN